uniref:Calcineurin-like phosphoesterase n=1 Tax=Candidatus Kentrum sp. DK TaxID=2126562 RepID=A0A450SZ35_9GAMM|nr:MAG: Calcineurin-like phosphoesterase [Candidatus Kentron sp. DK]
MTEPYVLLVIDDDLKARKPVYDAVFQGDDFQLRYVETPRELDQVMEPPIHGCLLDIILDQGPWGREGWTSEKVIEKYLASRKAPVFLVSQGWSDSSSGVLERVSAIMKAHRNTVEDFLDWSWFDTGIGGGSAAVKGKLRRVLDEWHMESLRILHIADLQFGDPNDDEEAFHFESLIADSITEDCKGHLDLIVITGDIAYKGTPSEYEAAARWLEEDLLNLLKRKGLDIDRERLLIIPGNHDIDRHLCRLLGPTDSKRGERPPSIEEESSTKNGRNEYKDCGLMPFLQFACSVSGGRHWERGRHKNHSWVSNRFIDKGVQFLLLNTMEGTDAKTLEKNREEREISVSEETLNFLREEMDDDIPTDRCNPFRILLLHHPLFEQREKWNPEAKQRLETFLKANHIDLILAGHNHTFQCKKKDQPGLPYVHTATPKLKMEKEGEEKKQRGFVLLELIRKNGKVTATQGTFYELLDGTVGKKEEIGPYERLP